MTIPSTPSGCGVEGTSGLGGALGCGTPVGGTPVGPLGTAVGSGASGVTTGAGAAGEPDGPAATTPMEQPAMATRATSAAAAMSRFGAARPGPDREERGM